jgi:hypothetical protein
MSRFYFCAVRAELLVSCCCLLGDHRVHVALLLRRSSLACIRSSPYPSIPEFTCLMWTAPYAAVDQRKVQSLAATTQFPHFKEIAIHRQDTYLELPSESG